MQRNAHLFKLIVLSMLVALGVVISPILRIEGMCPMAHFINITCAVLLGPWYALLCATTIGVLRMLLMGIPPLALTGAVFGAVLSGLLYRASGGKLIYAVLGEVIGTGLIGAIVSYPVMALLYGKTELTWMFYVPLFISGTLIGGTIAYFFLIAMRKNGMLKTMQQKLGAKIYDK
ncbi:energy coupling factor transporter S component ThiW [Propionispira arboris]|uniref:Energy coupling factor transporter S component ThiW n=1 Tax=Propionispira arboris TaxID=84035 RepID=A0A1H7AS95_9FIRM|nr:energy coupling factor transporter S component ThiW [Propionispira arboris]SEJ67514.1 energy coupling factor transporter S component ThiW [Propionispira arboris]